MDAMVTIKFRFDDICTELELIDTGMTFSQMVKLLIEEDGICSCMDNYEIVKVEEILKDGE